jgi:hypothetical protein
MFLASNFRGQYLQMMFTLTFWKFFSFCDIWQVAFHWEGNDEGEKQTFTYSDMLDKVSSFDIQSALKLPKKRDLVIDRCFREDRTCLSCRNPANILKNALSVHYRGSAVQVCRLANVLLSLGVQRGDRVAIYLPMIIELPVRRSSSFPPSRHRTICHSNAHSKLERLFSFQGILPASFYVGGAAAF